MDVIPAGVRCHLILRAIQPEGSAADSVGVATGEATKMRVLAKIGFQRVKTEHNVRHPALAIRHFDRDNDSAIISYSHLHAPGIPQGEKLHLIARGRLPPRLACDCSMRECKIKNKSGKYRAEGHKSEGCRLWRLPPFPATSEYHYTTLRHGADWFSIRSTGALLWLSPGALSH
ncbi:unannotated protein [freshwater metagenome]|uniref:Unannotated protein n=1 Tax=freshwater metagenome TaxID=449393 RepID=A0A6J6ZL32_9ZZZZ